MKKVKRSAAVDKIEHGPQKDKHINQYGDQSKDASRNKRKVNDDRRTGGKTLTGEDSAVQKNAHKNAKQKSKQ